ncbi:MAG TPA: hypothetical protein VMT90_08740 [Dehalococcoidia bacterium]|nr:hypothetical protein [Dehalococcoidia bacterium]
MIRRSLALVALTAGALAVLLMAATVACASKHEVAGTVTVTPTVPAASGSATDIPAIDAYVMYRDDVGDPVARNLKTAKVYKQTVDYNEEVIVWAACAGDGSRIAYLIQDFNEKFRRLSIKGDNAPADFIQIPATVQDFAWFPDGSKIALTEWDQQTDTASIVVLDVASGQTTPIWTGSLLAGGPAVSPDGKQLAYYLQDVNGGSSKIELLNTDGGDPRDLVAQSGLQWLDPAWAPDGKHIIATGLSPTASQMYQVDVETGATTQITQDTTIYRRGPQFSPDGSLIAYTGSIIPPSVSAVAVMMHQFGIFVVNPDGSGERPLTVDPRTNPGANVDPYLNAYLIGWCKPGPWLDDLWTPQEATE